MKKLFPLVVFCIFLILPLSQSAAQNYGAKSIFKKYNDAVVVVYACDSYGKAFAQGSGVVLNSKGLIVTNYHVCEGSTNIKIKHEDLLIEDVTILGGNADDDIMFLKIPENSNLNYIPAGNSDKLEVGQKVYALGSPLGFENSITEGIVNGIRKKDTYSDDSYIQLSASITHGSSGGALITAGGKLIGITCGGMKEGQNINFAIPINKVLSSSIYAANYYEEPEIKQKKTKKKKTKDITSTDGEKKTKKPKKKKSESENITSIAPSGSMEKIESKKGKDKSSEASYEKIILQARTAFEAGDINAAENYFNKAIEMDGQNSMGYLGRALCYFTKKKYEAALSDISYVIKVNPDYSYGYFMRAVVYHALERYRDAIPDYLSAIQLDKTNSYAVFGLGECYYETDEYEHAVLCFSTVIAFDKSKAIAYYYRGVCLLELGNDYGNLDACDDFEKAYSLGISEAADYIKQYCR